METVTRGENQESKTATINIFAGKLIILVVGCKFDHTKYVETVQFDRSNSLKDYELDNIVRSVALDTIIMTGAQPELNGKLIVVLRGTKFGNREFLPIIQTSKIPYEAIGKVWGLNGMKPMIREGSVQLESLLQPQFKQIASMISREAKNGKSGEQVSQICKCIGLFFVPIECRIPVQARVPVDYDRFVHRVFKAYSEGWDIIYSYNPMAYRQMFDCGIVGVLYDKELGDINVPTLSKCDNKIIMDTRDGPSLFMHLCSRPKQERFQSRDDSLVPRVSKGNGPARRGRQMNGKPSSNQSSRGYR